MTKRQNIDIDAELITRLSQQPINPDCCLIADFKPLLRQPHQTMTDSELLSLSRRGAFAPYFRWNGQRERPIFRRGDVLAWCVLLYGGDSDVVVALRKRGFKELEIVERHRYGRGAQHD